ncbi:MAG: hypothetical protein IPL42_09605 [Saprospiraceae bacterium]|nr:hypothetical protein [Saprospiraceae bacterium]
MHNHGSIYFVGCVTLGGTYSGAGVSNGNFNPAVAGVGVHTLTYTVAHPITGCTKSCNFNITVNALPIVTCPANFAVCSDPASFPLTGGLPTGGTYTGPGVSGGIFNPLIAGVGTYNNLFLYRSCNRLR